MKLPVSKTNAPVWRDITIKSVLPEALKPLETLSRNLWYGTAQPKTYSAISTQIFGAQQAKIQ